MKKQKQAKNTCHITKADRSEIEILLARNYSSRKISLALGKAHDAVGYEIRNNSVNGIYNAQKAHRKAYARRKYSKYQGMKVREDKQLEEYVHEKLALDWSPEEISGRIKHIEKRIKYASASAIYKYVYSVHGRWLERFLRYKNKRKKGGNRSKVTGLKDRIFIQDRPKIIGKRRRFGDWEGDFIVSGKNGSGALLVLVERKTRYVIIRRLLSRDTTAVNAAILEMTGGMLYVNSLTIDNDISFQKHKQLSKSLGAPVFFCQPYHSWEKGAVENMNKWIRQYAPKKTDISQLTDGYIEFVENRLNNRPRKCLKFRTPFEVMKRNKQFKSEVCAMLKINVNKNSPVAELRG
jgi:Transposase and inactivated derivatives, IS30 family